jgi:hypothetical protein
MDGYFKVLYKTMDYNEISNELYGQASDVALIEPVRTDEEVSGARTVVRPHSCHFLAVLTATRSCSVSV